jgi:O-antigen/teichoic acid export membrane protein
VSFGLVGVYFLIPDIIVRLLFGEAYHVPGNILGLFGLFLALFSISNIITMTSLALGKLNVWIFPIVGAFLQIIGIIFYHSSMLSVLYVNILICAILAIVLFVYYMKTAYEKV